MGKYTYASELFLDELLRISSNIVWKNPYLALYYESKDYITEVEHYILSRQGRLVFSVIDRFDEEVLRSLGFRNEEIVVYSNNKFAIPEEMRDKCVERQSEWNIKNYVEHNNYYRMLNGLPNIEDTEDDFFYNIEYPTICDANIPLHELDSSKLYQLEAKGLIAKLIKENPDKGYLKYLTEKKIDVYNARNSDPFSLLWIADSSYETLVNDFVDTYKDCRYMIVSVFYQKTMTSSNTEYVGFIGLMILWYTIMQMQVKFLDTDITRDFYDEDSLRCVYDSYGVPFFSKIPMEYHKRIVKNINILLSHKGSTKVFYDLFDIFDFDGMSIFEYYMMKVHRFENGKPVFVKKEDGSYNYQEMFNVILAKVRLYDDPFNEMRDKRNQLSYESITRNDLYWINDKDLITKIYEEEYNYMESKYLGIQTTFNLMKILYETTYYIKLILDNRDMLSGTTVYNNSTHSNVNLFDLVIYTCAIITKKYGYSGNIPNNLHEIGKVMGFNFQQDLTILKNNITKDDYLKNDPTLLDLLDNMVVNSLASVKRVYSNLTELREYLSRKMAETDDVNTYWAYYELFNTIMYSEYVGDTFTKNNGKQAATFAELLEDINPDLYVKYNSMEEVDDEEITNSLYLLKTSCNKLKRIQYADSINIDTVMEYLFKLLDFFKSAKADLTGYKIIYSLISSIDNITKFMDQMVWCIDDHTSDPQYTIFDELTDLIWRYKFKMHLLCRYKLLDEMVREDDTIYLSNYIILLEDQIVKITKKMEAVVSSEKFIDQFYSSKEIFLIPGKELGFEDELIPLLEELKEILKFSLADEYGIMDMIVNITKSIESSKLTNDEKITFLSRLMLFFYIKFKSSYKFDIEFVDKHHTYYIDDSYLFIDQIIHIFKKHYINEDLPLNDEICHFYFSRRADKSEYKFDDRLLISTIVLLYKDIEDNPIYYLDKILNFIFKYFIDDWIMLYDKMSCIESYKSIADKLNSYAHLITISSKEKSRKSELCFGDSLTLRYEVKINDDVEEIHPPN